MRKVIKTKDEARQSLRLGADKAANIIKATLGPSGRNIIFGRPFQSPEITNDGATISQEIYLEDEIEQLGADLIKEIAKNADNKAGDGTTTATVLAQAILKVGFDRLTSESIYIKDTIDPMLIKKQIDEAYQIISEKLTEIAIQISSLEDIKKVAFVSVENEAIAETIADMFHKTGKDGNIVVEDGYGEIEPTLVEGFEIEAGLTSSVLANNGKKFILDKPLIVVTTESLEFPDQVIPLTQMLNKQGHKSLIIIGDNFSKDLLKSFIMAKVTGQFNVIAIKTPYFGRKEKMEDIALILGAKFFDKELDMKIKEAKMEELATPGKIIISDEKTIILNAKGDVRERLDDLTKQLGESKSKFDQNELKKRIAKLSGSIGVIKVGAESETERIYLKKKIEDAVNATKYALQDGVVKGGGLALKEISEKLDKNILSEAILAPYNQIQENSGGLVIGDDIMDPVKVTKSALKSACSVAGLILTIDTAIADKYEKPKDLNYE